MTTIAIGDHPVATVSYEWTPPDNESEAAIAGELCAATACFLGNVVRPRAVDGAVGRVAHGTRPSAVPEARVALFAAARDEVAVVRRPGCAIDDSPKAWIDEGALDGWVARLLDDGGAAEVPDGPSLRAVWIEIADTYLPPRHATAGAIRIEARQNSYRLDVLEADGTTWLPPLPAAWTELPPLSIMVSNDGFECSCRIVVNWGPWVPELARSESPLARACAALAERGWERVSDDESDDE